MSGGSDNKKIFIILGPTSSGKTSLALDMCKKFNGSIISADSRQAFKHMNIGTGKVPVGTNLQIERNEQYWKIDGVKVYGYDIADLAEYFSGYDFAKFALEKTGDIFEEGKNVFIVGGTGFYIDLFTGKIKPSNVKPDLLLRKELETMSLKELQDKLENEDPDTFGSIDRKNKIRLIRALEKLLSKNINEESLPYIRDVEYVKIGLTAPREYLYKRADIWVDEIWKNGLIDEVRELIKKGYEESPKLKGLVYKTTVDFINKRISEEQAVERIKFDIHAYIRRQQNWFKRDPDIVWVDISQDDFREIIYNMVKENI